MKSTDMILCHRTVIDDQETLILWTWEDHWEAVIQGWYLDHETGRLTADPDRPDLFCDDADAFETVRRAARGGERRAIIAMIFDALSRATAWIDRLAEEMRP